MEPVELLEPISSMSHKDDGASEQEERMIVLCVIFPSDNQSAEVELPGKESLDLPAFPVAPQPSPVVPRQSPAVAAMRADQVHFLPGHVGKNRTGIDFIKPNEDGTLSAIEFGTGRKPSVSNPGEMSWGSAWRKDDNGKGFQIREKVPTNGF